MNAASQSLKTTTLGNALWPEARVIKPVILVVAGSLALALSAKIQVPFWPVPMTMQSLVVLLIGMTFGSRLGALTLLAYLAEGFAGLPVFAGAAAGPLYMTGPTAGYLVGFLLSAGAIGWLAEHGWSRDLWRTALAMTLGHVLLFVPGVLWLAVLFGWPKAFAVGVTPFIAATILKTGLGVAIVAALWALVRRRQPPAR
jgi:biotin transport system substrate-specific component